MPGGRGVPDRWLAYTKTGQPIPETRFVAFKTPLEEARFNHLLPDSERFSPADLVDGLPDLGLVIDLTNTDRYYPGRLIDERGVKYRKLNCAGHWKQRHQKPSAKVVKRFFGIVEEFLRSTPGSRSLIGVHCTHGVNRTGYLVCSYMIQRMGYRPRDAIAAFAAARGHPIEHAEFVQGLHACTPSGSGRGPGPREALGRVAGRMNNLSVQ